MVETPLALVAVGLAGGVLAWAVALLVLRGTSGSGTGRILAGILALEGALQFSTGTSFLDAEPRLLVLAQDVGFMVWLSLLPWLYLLFLSTLDTPLAAPLRRGRRVVLAVLAFYALLLAVSFTQRLVDDAGPSWADAFLLVAFLAIGLTSVYGLVVAVSAWRRAARGTLARQRAGAYALAFGTRDTLLVLAIAAFFVEEALAPHEGIHVTAAFLAAVSTLLYVPLLAYGVLRTQLLGIEPRLRWTISRGTVAAAFVAVYVVASQAAALLLAPRWGPTAGVAAAGALVLALVPLQRWAERLAAAAVPEPSSSALDDRRLEVYRLALEDAGPSRGAREAEFLARLRERLGITERDHAIVEHFVRSRERRAERPGDIGPGDVLLARYRVLEPLGEGGHARVYLAEDERLARRVVLKAFRPDRESAVVLAEAKALARLRHPNVAAVHDAHASGGEAFLVMEHVEGGSLASRLRAGPLDGAAVARVGLDVLDALVAVHDAGLVHRDVKPANVLLTGDGRAKLADFGVAALVGVEATRGDVVDYASAVGTIPYMSPEQAKGQPATPRSDQYAAALTLFEAYTGTRLLAPRPGESAAELQARAARPPPFAGVPDAPPALDAWFRRALAAPPRERFESTREARDAFAAAVEAGHSS